MMPQGAKDHLGYVLGHQGDHEVLPLMQNAVEARTELAQSGQLAGNRCTLRSLHSNSLPGRCLNLAFVQPLSVCEGLSRKLRAYIIMQEHRRGCSCKCFVRSSLL